MHICHLSTVHRSDDVRIFQKQCRSLVLNDFRVSFVVPDDEDREEDGVRIVVIERNMSKFARLFVQPFKALNKALKIKADIYQFHDYELWLVGFILKLLGKKVVADIHEDVPGQLLQRTWIPPVLRGFLSKVALNLENTLARFMSGIITADEVLARRFSSLNGHVTAIENYPILIEIPTENLHDNFVVKSFGGVFDERCAHTVIGASKIVSDTMFEIGGGLASSYQDLAWQSDNCLYLGRVPSNDIYQHYVDADVLVVMFSDAPNHQDIKSNRLFESMYAERPIVVSNLPKWKNFIDTHECGLVVDPDSPEQLAEAIVYLKQNPDLAVDMGRRGKQAVLKGYSWESQVTKLTEFYRQI